MTTATKSARVRKQVSQNAHKKQLTDKLKDLELVGEIITWAARDGHTVTLDEVRNALRAQGLNYELAKDFQPEQAFNRAVTKLEKDWLVEEVWDDGSEVRYQFTHRELQSGEWVDMRKTYLNVNKVTGVVSGKHNELVNKAQELLNHCLLTRTASDLTRITQQLFDAYAEQNPTGNLIPVRRQGGAYLVLSQHLPFVDKIQGFLEHSLGGEVNRWPIPAGTSNGDRSAQKSITEYLGDMLKDLNGAVENFNVFTRGDTIEEHAARINGLRQKAEAYAQWLGDQKDQLVDELNQVTVKLITKVDQLSKDKEAMPQRERGASKEAVYRAWLADKDISPEDALAAAGGMVQLTTVRSWLGGWAKGRGLPASARNGKEG